MRPRLAAARQARREAEVRLKRLESAGVSAMHAITPTKMERLGTASREALATDDPAARRACLRLFVNQAVVTNTEIRLRRHTRLPAKAAYSGELPPTAAMVPSFVQGWRPVGDSNPCYRRERGITDGISPGSTARTY